MSIGQLQLLRNLGQFDNVAAGAHLPFTKLTLIYAENGRGKTTIAALLRSASNNEPQLVLERQRLGSAHSPHVVIGRPQGATMFQHGAWTAPIPEIAVFDDTFVAANVCSGIEIEPAHRQNLHELILGAQGVALNAALQAQVALIEQHNQTLRRLEAAIPAAGRGRFNVDDFCALPAQGDIDAAIASAERNLAAARAADGIRQHSNFQAIALPDFDVAAVNEILGRQLPDLEAAAAARVRDHLRSLGRGGEAWVADGMMRVAQVSEGRAGEVCPFCAQDLPGSPLIAHYQAYFSAAYDTLKTAITQAGQAINQEHAGDVPAAFERAVRVADQTRAFWAAFTEMPAIDIDTAAIARDWNVAREAVLVVLRAKAAAPLEPMALAPETLALIEAYSARRREVAAFSGSLTEKNSAIDRVKEQAAAANVPAAEGDLARLQAVQNRHMEPVAGACQAYLDEKAAKAVTEAARGQARDALDNYRLNIFPAYQGSINDYLARFNAGFRLDAVGSVNTRAGSSCTYTVVINNVTVALTAAAGPSFRTTLSAGDRNTLALAFFFASLDQDPAIAQKIVVIDDPMTSLDEHRSLATIQEMRLLQARVAQVIVLSHSKPFLCNLWEGCDDNERSAYIIQRDGQGSTLAAWDVRQDCITEHDRRHERVRLYMQAGNPATARQVATDLRPIMEAFVRVAYPEHFPPGAMLGAFHTVCNQRIGTPGEILNLADTAELRALLDYANRFHHDTNPAYETAQINDGELLNITGRVLAFAARR